jgi:hypothetical protein
MPATSMLLANQMAARMLLSGRSKAITWAVLLISGALNPGALAFANSPSKKECVEANESAQALRKSGKLRDARGQLLVCAVQACPGPVRADCAQMLHEIDRVQPEVVFGFKDEGGEEVGKGRLTLDGQVLPEFRSGSPIAVDPGPHELSFEADGFSRREMRFAVEEGETRRVSVVMQPLPKTKVAPVVATMAPERQESHGATLLLAGYVSLGVGAGVVVVGSVFGTVALAKKSSLDSICDANHACPSAAQGDIDALHSNTIAANVTLGISVLGLGAGGVLLWLSRGAANASPRAPSSSFSIGPRSLSMRASF